MARKKKMFRISDPYLGPRKVVINSSVSLDEARARIIAFYPDVDVEHPTDPCACHVRNIFKVIEGSFRIVHSTDGCIDEHTKKVGLLCDCQQFVDLFLAKIRYWKWVRKNDLAINEHELAALLPTHEEILAFRVLTWKDYPFQTMADELDSEDGARHLLDPKVFDTEEIIEESGAIVERRDTAHESITDVTSQADKLSKIMLSELEVFQREKREAETKEKSLLEGIKSIDNIIASTS